ncbi:hypothetical protein TTHERM_01006400 (macronuclear) [Tetrahymena thermophila SB210]|uniref:Uncharacterized protein n=1 Tax=Tetrahymena thermophila (strain SB210) TaxID=312017 RepID=Q22D20_TETTS|nr:hypothetical protein TTHERM_01006400 [Tetrahymena thermophila SB210]EAR83169.2 hypothetical protein TTHERM_01006400 [Tetrahymena thermophila SB210]|eukprot:XP_001030832.2 hypothetical protein TTHERM_01006400 [Tetrahymena thermophila SB210]
MGNNREGIERINQAMQKEELKKELSEVQRANYRVKIEEKSKIEGNLIQVNHDIR